LDIGASRPSECVHELAPHALARKALLGKASATPY
jgi:hypothetical protein